MGPIQRLKFSWANKSCVSVSSQHLGPMVVHSGLQKTWAALSHGLSHSLALSSANHIAWHILHTYWHILMPQLSMAASASISQLPTWPCQGLLTGILTLLVFELPGFISRSWWKHLWPPNSSILNSCRSSTRGWNQGLPPCQGVANYLESTAVAAFAFLIYWPWQNHFLVACVKQGYPHALFAK